MERIPASLRLLRKTLIGDECWIFTGAKDAKGYGSIFVDGKIVGAHRLSYETFVGSIPPKKDLDHLCRVPACVRPDHLEAVSRGENVRRGTSFAAVNAAKTHCPLGHPYDETNTYLTPKGGRECRNCVARRSREYKARRIAS